MTDDDRFLIAEARRIGPALRASTGDGNRAAGWLLAELADLAERLAGGVRPAAGHGDDQALLAQ